MTKQHYIKKQITQKRFLDTEETLHTGTNCRIDFGCTRTDRAKILDTEATYTKRQIAITS